MTDPTEEAYYTASWRTIIEIARKEYLMSEHMATIYAWIIFGRMASRDYKKLEH